VTDPINVPGARYGSFSWIDVSGELWLFGGSGYDASGSWNDLNDLWKLRFCKQRPIVDLNSDCTVNFIDFSMMAVHWLEDGWQY